MSTRKLFLIMPMALASACALVSPLTPPIGSLLGNGSLSVGEWSGSTSHGEPISFTVRSEDEMLTTLAISYAFNGCTGANTFTELAVPTAHQSICVSGPCPSRIGRSRSFGFVEGAPTTGPYTQVNGIFLPGDQARGQAIFSGYPGCGSATVEWTATRR